ncbi:methyltransferase domain-containing protein [Actinomadura spongiicola]|uniref:Methyltransferase domain-containing protein n=1 Tax=Actinomadura spongiicola TaxID=2303421 RepID=A0A372GGC8_9ACTN|nr:class I SAM-dependent methyltransferase [Actinomadura spongiicola]RFS84232.1 methyltransferase domain-containing protein [Actinomadura spongiicola]
MVVHTAGFLEDSRRYLFDDGQLRGVYERLGARETRRGLDIGCGTGHFTRIVADLCPEGRWYGVDLDAPVLAHAARPADAHLRPAYLQADGGRLPFRDGTFDTTSCHFLLARISARKVSEVLREMARVTDPDGRLIFVEPCLGLTSVHFAGDGEASRALERVRRAKADVERGVNDIDENLPLRLPGLLNGLGYDVAHCELLAGAWWSVLPDRRTHQDPEFEPWLTRRHEAFDRPDASATLGRFGRHEGGAAPLRHGPDRAPVAVRDAYRRAGVEDGTFDAIRRARARVAAAELAARGRPAELSLEVLPVLCVAARRAS